MTTKRPKLPQSGGSYTAKPGSAPKLKEEPTKPQLPGAQNAAANAQPAKSKEDK